VLSQLRLYPAANLLVSPAVEVRRHRNSADDAQRHNPLEAGPTKVDYMCNDEQ
jgi:hypothetical protein